MSATLTFVIGERSPMKLIETDGELNMANGNARAFLNVLGLNTDFENARPMPIGELSEAIRLYETSELRQLVDTGSETRVYGGGEHCTIIVPGKREGYYADKITVAKQLIAEALSKGATHCYFA